MGLSNTAISQFIALFLFSCIQLAYGATTWLQVDDTDPRLSYSGQWDIGSHCDGESCLSPNMTNVFKGTWHIAQPGPSDYAIVTFQFTGVGIQVTSLTDDRSPGPSVRLAINLDGTTFNYYRDPIPDGTVGTGISVFHQTQLENIAHTLSISIDPTSSLLLDFMAYEAVDAQSEAPSTTEEEDPITQAIAGSTSTITVTSSPSSTTSTIGLSTTSAKIDTVLATLSSGSTTFSSSSSGNVMIPTTSSPPTSHRGLSSAVTAAVGAALGVFLMILIVLTLFCLKKRKASRLRSGSTNPYTFGVSPPTRTRSTFSVVSSPNDSFPFATGEDSNPFEHPNDSFPFILNTPQRSSIQSRPATAEPTPMVENRPLVLVNDHQYDAVDALGLATLTLKGSLRRGRRRKEEQAGRLGRSASLNQAVESTPVSPVSGVARRASLSTAPSPPAYTP